MLLLNLLLGADFPGIAYFVSPVLTALAWAPVNWVLYLRDGAPPSQRRLRRDRRPRAARPAARAHGLPQPADAGGLRDRRRLRAAAGTLRVAAGGAARATTTRSPRRTASRSCRWCPTAASSSTATARCSRRTTPPTRSRSRRAGWPTSSAPSTSSPTVIEVSAARPAPLPASSQEESKNFESLPIRTRLTEEEVARFAVNRYRFPGFEIKARLFRSYPHGEVASHAIGYIGRINDADVKRIEAARARHQLQGHRPHRQARHRGRLREGAARRHRQRAGRDRRRRARHPLARAQRAACRATTWW